MKVRSIGEREPKRVNLLRFLWVAMDAIEAMTVLIKKSLYTIRIRGRFISTAVL